MAKFPKYFWNCSGSDIYAPKIVRYLMEDVLGWSDEDIKKNLRKETFRDYKLAGMLSIKYDNSPYKAITKAYPERNYKAWDFVNAPNNYWQGEDGRENAIEAVKWLIEEKLKWSMEDVRKNINHQVFIDHNLLGMLKKVFNSVLFDAIDSAYPGVFKRWELGGHVANDYWTEKEGILATRWLIEEKLKWTDDDVKKYYGKQIFIDNNLYGMIQRCFNTSPYEALNKAYPGRFNEWELICTPQNFWTKEENVLKAIKWLIEDKLRLDREEIRKKINGEVLKKNGLVVSIEKYGVRGLIELYLKHY